MPLEVIFHHSDIDQASRSSLGTCQVGKGFPPTSLRNSREHVGDFHLLIHSQEVIVQDQAPLVEGPHRGGFFVLTRSCGSACHWLNLADPWIPNVSLHVFWNPDLLEKDLRLGYHGLSCGLFSLICSLCVAWPDPTCLHAFPWSDAKAFHPLGGLTWHSHRLCPDAPLGLAVVPSSWSLSSKKETGHGSCQWNFALWQTPRNLSSRLLSSSPSPPPVGFGEKEELTSGKSWAKMAPSYHFVTFTQVCILHTARDMFKYFGRVYSYLVLVVFMFCSSRTIVVIALKEIKFLHGLLAFLGQIS